MHVNCLQPTQFITIIIMIIAVSKSLDLDNVVLLGYTGTSFVLVTLDYKFSSNFILSVNNKPTS